MQVQDFILAIRRRWYLALSALVLSVVATLATLALVGPTYEAKGTTLLVPPGATLQQQRPGEAVSTGNPYLELSGLGQARDIVIRSMTSQSTFLALCSSSGDEQYLAMRAALCQAHPKVKYTVTPDYESSAPVIMVTIEADSRPDAITALGAVMNQVPVSLRTLQGSLNLRARADITSTPVTADVVPVVVRKDQIRAGILVGGGSLALFLLAIGLLDSLLLSRGSRAGRTVEVSAPADEVSEAGWGWDGENADAPTASAPPAERSEVEETDGWSATASGERRGEPDRGDAKVPQPTSAGWG